jgi:uncharacterized protein YggE
MSGLARRGALLILATFVTGVALHAAGWIGPRGTDVLAADPSAASVGGSPRTVTVVGDGDVPVTPATASVQLGVAVHRPNVRAAYDRAGAAMAALIAAVKGQGVAPADIQTTALQVSSDSTSGSAGGYQVLSSVTVILRQLDRAETVIAAAASW